MRLVDTSAWLEWLCGTATGKALESRLPKAEAWLVPTIVQLELSKWLLRESSEEKADQVIAFTQTCIVAELDTAIALRAAELGIQFKLSTADAIIYATALAYDANILTCDRHFEGLESVHYVPKANT